MSGAALMNWWRWSRQVRLSPSKTVGAALIVSDPSRLIRTKAKALVKANADGGPAVKDLGLDVFSKEHHRVRVSGQKVAEPGVPRLCKNEWHLIVRRRP